MIGRDCDTLNGIALEEASAPLAYSTRVGAYDNSSDSLIPFDQQGGRSQRHHLLTRADEHAVTPDRLLATHTERWGAIARSVGARRRPAGLRLAPLARKVATREEG